MVPAGAVAVDLAVVVPGPDVVRAVAVVRVVGVVVGVKKLSVVVSSSLVVVVVLVLLVVVVGLVVVTPEPPPGVQVLPLGQHPPKASQ